MFNLKELLVIAGALVVQQKSVMRLAQKEGQPETVALEYRKVSGEIESILKKVNGLVVSEQSKKEGK